MDASRNWKGIQISKITVPFLAEDASSKGKGTIHILLMKTPLGIENEFKLVKSQFLFKQMTPLWIEKEPFIFIYGDASLKVLWMEIVPMGMHIGKYYSKNLNLGPEGLPVDKKSVSSTVFHAIFNGSGADTARICYLK